MTRADDRADELVRLRDAHLALTRHLRDDHHDWRGGNSSQQHAWHLAHHRQPFSSHDPHPIVGRERL